MALIDSFHKSEKMASTHSWILAKHQATALSVDELAKLTAELIMEHRCRGCHKYYEQWKEQLDGGVELPESVREALKAFIEPVFGLPGNSE